MRFILAALFAFTHSIIVSHVAAQIPYFTRCPHVSVVQDFDAEAYLGLWYEQEKYPFIFQLGGKCVTAEYTLRPDGKVGVFNRQLNSILGGSNTISGYAEPSGEEAAKLKVTFPTTPGPAAPYWVIGTDYQNYAVVYSCASFGGFFNTRNVWILTRQRHPPHNVIQTAHDILDTKGITRSFLIKTDQTGCEDVSQNQVWR